MPDRPRYMISVAAELAGLHPQTMRMYENRGLVRPARTPGGTRLYSENDVERLKLIQRLTTELGLNLAGVEHVLRLEDELRRLNVRMRQLERELREEIRTTHQQYRREIVVYREPQHVLDAREVEPELRRQALDQLQALDVVLGVEPGAARRPGGPHETAVLVHPHRLRMEACELGGDGDHVARAVGHHAVLDRCSRGCSRDDRW